jgi:hypothetical protein
MLAREGLITDEGGVVGILQKADPAGDGVEAVAQLRTPLRDEVYQGVHHSVEDYVYNGSPW